MDKPACHTCKFWEPVSAKEFENEGKCHRNAPVPFHSHTERTHEFLKCIMWATYASAGIDEEEFHANEKEASIGSTPWAFWPVTMDVDWCGEYVNKLAA